MGKTKKSQQYQGIEDNRVMKPSDFKRWRKSLRLSQKQAAEALGLKRRVVQYYEKGVRDGYPVEIPKSIRLACFALSRGCADYSGPMSDQADPDLNRPSFADAPRMGALSRPR